MDFIKRNIAVIVMTIVFGAVVSLLGTLYAQQNKKIDEKANEGEVIIMIEKLEAIRQHTLDQQKEERTEQKALNKDMIQTLQQLNLQIMLLNEKLKKGE
jgi:hypothetical protein